MTIGTLGSQSPAETREIGERMATLLAPGDVLLLSGELGAGKTTFVQGLAHGLGFEGSVSSKSFVLMGEYSGRIKLYHADLYRLEDPVQVWELGLEEISQDGVLVVEWAERAPEILPAEHLLVEFRVVAEDSRELAFNPAGERAIQILRNLEERSRAR